MEIVYQTNSSNSWRVMSAWASIEEKVSLAEYSLGIADFEREELEIGQRRETQLVVFKI